MVVVGGGKGRGDKGGGQDRLKSWGCNGSSSGRAMWWDALFVIKIVTSADETFQQLFSQLVVV